MQWHLIAAQRWFRNFDGVLDLQVGRSRSVKGADYALESIHNLKETLPVLWEDVAMPLEADHPGKPAVETFVTA